MADSAPTGRRAGPHTARDPAQGRTGRHAGAPGPERNAPPRHGDERGVGRRAGSAAVPCATAIPVPRARAGGAGEAVVRSGPGRLPGHGDGGSRHCVSGGSVCRREVRGARRPPVRHGPRRPGRTGERGACGLRSPRAPGDGVSDRHPPGLRRRRLDAAAGDSTRRSDVSGAAGNRVLPARLHCPASLRQALTAGGTGPCDDPRPPPATAPRRPCSPLASPSPLRRTPATPPGPPAPLRPRRIRTSGAPRYPVRPLIRRPPRPGPAGTEGRRGHRPGARRRTPFTGQTSSGTADLMAQSGHRPHPARAGPDLCVDIRVSS